MTVYLEPFILINFVMNLTILSLCQRCTGVSVRLKKTLLSSLMGCAYSLFCCIYDKTWIAGIPARLICAAAMCFLVLPLSDCRQYIKLFISFSLCTFLLGGTGFALMFMMGFGGFRTWMALVCCIICSLLIYFLLGRKRQAIKAAHKIKLKISSLGHEFDLTALIDSGNLLTEPLSCLPVIVCTDISLIHFLRSTSLTLPYRGAGGDGMYILYKADAIYTTENEKKQRLGDAYIAFDTRARQSFDFELIIPLSLFY
ncbi:MAG: hypothetical protein E7334_09115 [Clostridiales bacterium]|nr:hypothetical protein [Clostridiales bacterium]MBQ2816705.1 sigma-E processing peptidase SpoIIGA [Clostridia bacterium]